jgi:hypothetical protein
MNRRLLIGFIVLVSSQMMFRSTPRSRSGDAASVLLARLTVTFN